MSIYDEIVSFLYKSIVLPVLLCSLRVDLCSWWLVVGGGGGGCVVRMEKVDAVLPLFLMRRAWIVDEKASLAATLPLTEIAIRSTKSPLPRQ